MPAPAISRRCSTILRSTWLSSRPTLWPVRRPRTARLGRQARAGRQAVAARGSPAGPGRYRRPIRAVGAPGEFRPRRIGLRRHRRDAVQGARAQGRGLVPRCHRGARAAEGKASISAVVLVGGKPSPLVSALPANAGIHLLPISFGLSLETVYLPTRFDAGDYPNLIQEGTEVADGRDRHGAAGGKVEGRSRRTGARGPLCRRRLSALRRTPGARATIPNGARSISPRPCRASNGTAPPSPGLPDNRSSRHGRWPRAPMRLKPPRKTWS